MKRRFTVVAIGASAGGLPALEELFSAIAAEGCGDTAAFCVVQHLSPNFKSLMAQILERHTSLKIVVADDGMAIEPGHIYLNRRDQHVTVDGAVFRLQPKGSRESVRFPIDLFLESVAESFAERAIAVVLSGTGSDASRGVLAIKRAGGEVCIQHPESAQFDGMPNAALAATETDYVGSPSELANYLAATINDLGDGPTNAEEPSEEWAENWEALLRLLRSHAKIDFSRYKRPTLLRRLDKHLAATRVSLPEYVRQLRDDMGEREALVRDFLIGVTSFFRDPEVFAVLEEEILPAIVREREPEQEIRLWIAGCSSGEEAYSYAMMLHELGRRLGKEEPIKYKILATDVDSSAVAIASEGRYPASAVRGIPRRLVDGYFTRMDGDYVICREIRDRVIFSVHDVISDPPFVRIDLVSMRNLMIYLSPDAQRDALGSAAFALRPGGTLVLGASGSTNALSAPFEPIRANMRIFSRRADGGQRWAYQGGRRLSLRAYDRGRLSAKRRGAGNNRSVDEWVRALLNTCQPPTIIIDEGATILYVHGEVGSLLSIPSGPPTSDLRQLTRGTVGGVILSLFRQVKQSGTSTTVEAVPIDGSDEVVDLTIRPMDGDAVRFAVVFRRRAADPERGEIRSFADEDVSRVAELERLLAAKQEELQSLIEELETANEELQSTNEELLAGNEELQSTNEELQSVNEELYTVNGELEERNTDLLALNDDIKNLLNTTNIATLFLDAELKIRRFTPAFCEVISLTQADVGRPITVFTSTLDEPSGQMTALAKEVLGDRKAREGRVRDQQGRIYLRRCFPFITEAESCNGVLFSLVDITSVEAMEAERARHDLETAAAFDLLAGVFFEHDPSEGRLRMRGDIAALVPGSTELLLDLPVAEFLGGVHADDRDAFELALGRRADAPPATVNFRLAYGRDRWIHVRARMRGHLGEAGRLMQVGVLLDVTEWVENGLMLERSRARLDLLMSNLPNGIVSVLDQDLVHRELYGRELGRLNVRVDDIVGRTLEEIYSPESAARIRENCELALENGVLVSFENSFGSQTYLCSVCPMVGGDRRIEFLVLSTNITELRIAREALHDAKEAAERANSARLTFLASMSHELRTPLAGMMGLLDLVDGNGALSGPDRGHIDQLRALVETQERLISDLLDLSRIDAQQLDLRSTRFDVAEALADLEARSAEGSGDITVMIQLPPAGTTFISDPLRVHQIVDNLLSNALKYTEEGTIEVQVGVDGRGRLSIEVADTGVGIAKSDLERVFEVFARVGDLQHSVSGFGLGLPLVKRLVEQMGGQLDIDSAADEGTTFRILLPPDELAEEEPAQDTTLATRGLSGRRVLLVEDNEVIRVVVGELLRRDGMEVVEVVDADTADQALTVNTFDALLIDIGLPDRDGHALIRSIRAAEDEGRIPIIALTAHAYREDRERSLAAGADVHVAKPVSQATLRRVLKSVVHRSDN